MPRYWGPRLTPLVNSRKMLGGCINEYGKVALFRVHHDFLEFGLFDRIKFAPPVQLPWFQDGNLGGTMAGSARFSSD